MATTKVREAQEWIDAFNENHPGTFVDLSEEEEEAVCGWIRDIQNQAIAADRQLLRQTAVNPGDAKAIEAFVGRGIAAQRALDGLPPLQHVGGSMLDTKPSKP